MIKVIALTMGDPSGIGPEIIIKSLIKKELSRLPIIVVGCVKVFRKMLDLKLTPHFTLKVIQKVTDASFESGIINIIDESIENIELLIPGKIQRQSGDVAYRCIKKATELALKNDVMAVVTAPINKTALNIAGHKYPGHMEILAHLTQSKDCKMMLYSENIKIIHNTTHISLKKSLDNINVSKVASTIRMANIFFKNLGYKSPAIGVAGVNPHSGENGLFGDEEINIIKPIIKYLKKKENINVFGPYSPDIIFKECIQGVYDVVVAMYHDQGHIVFKCINLYKGINITIGLPFLRTSVAHGTAFNIAWTGKACFLSMVEALRLSSTQKNFSYKDCERNFL